MYLVPIQVPIYVEGDRNMVTTEWHRSLILLRDSFNGRFGDITLVAPRLPARTATSEQKLIEVPAKTEGLKLHPSFDKRCRARQFWMRDRGKWRADLKSLMPLAQVVHAGVDDVYRPIAFEGFRLGFRYGKPTVFVQDTDNVVQQRQLAGAARESRSVYLDLRTHVPMGRGPRKSLAFEGFLPHPALREVCQERPGIPRYLLFPGRHRSAD
jgi:hypothetical protein